MTWLKTSTGPWILVLIVSALVFFNFFLPGTTVDAAVNELLNWTLIMSGIAVCIGMINVTRNALREIRRKAPGRWHLAIFQMFLIAVMLISGFGEGALSTVTGRGAIASVIRWMYENVLVYGLQAASALSALWLVTAAYRAYVARTVETFLFLVGGIFLLLKMAPIGGAIWMGFPLIGTWLQDVIFSGVTKALSIAMALGILIYAVRYYIGKERVALGVAE
jgi:hypothetical protein